jgi:hypothetical protein
MIAAIPIGIVNAARLTGRRRLLPFSARLSLRSFTGRPGRSTGTSRARRRISYEGTPRRARVPPVDYRDGLSGA